MVFICSESDRKLQKIFKKCRIVWILEVFRCSFSRPYNYNKKSLDQKLQKEERQTMQCPNDKGKHY